MDKKAEETARRAAQLFAQGEYYCAESVLLALAEETGAQNPQISDFAIGLCSGVARTGGPCGALLGAIMALGMTAEREKKKEREAVREVVYEDVRVLIAAFEKAHGARDCPALTGCDLATPEGQARFARENCAVRCETFVRTAAREASRLLAARR